MSVLARVKHRLHMLFLSHHNRCIKVKRRLHMLFLSHHNRCIIETTDMATGRPNKGGIPLTAFKHVCILCGQEFECITQSGIEQIASGVPYNEAIQWMNERSER